MSVSRLLLPSSLVAAFILGNAVPAFAEDSVDALVARGVAQYKSGDFAASAATLARAYAIDPKPRLLFNLARAEEKAGNTADALAHYRAYLGASDTETALLQRSREAVSRLETPDPPPEPTVRPAPPLPPAPSPPLAPSPAPAPPPSPAPEPSHPSPLGYVVLGTGAAVVAAGFGVGLWAKATASDEKNSESPTEKPALRDSAYARATAADITMAAGAILVTSALVYLLWPRRAPSRNGTSALSGAFVTWDFGG